MPDDAVSGEEWSVIRALRRLGRPDAREAGGVSRNDRESAYRHLEGEIFDTVSATLDRMIDGADHTSANLDLLLQRLSETAGLRRPAA